MSRGLYLLARAGFLLLLVMVVSFGCSSAGTPFPRDNESKIVKGLTTKNDVRGYFGDPLTIEAGVNSTEVWTYTYVQTNMTGFGVVTHVVAGVDQAETAYNKLIIIFDGDVVKDYHPSNNSQVNTYIR